MCVLGGGFQVLYRAEPTYQSRKPMLNTVPDSLTKLEHQDDNVTTAGNSDFAQRWVKFIVIWNIIIAIGLWWTCFFLTWPGELVPIYFTHFPVTVGIPCAMTGAFIICALFRTIDGRIKFGGLGFTLEGAAGPIIMWVICFSSFVISIRVLWPLTAH
jgi:hypothetical protein